MFNHNTYSSNSQLGSNSFSTPAPVFSTQQKSSAPSTPYVRSYFQQPAQQPPTNLQPAQPNAQIMASSFSGTSFGQQIPQLPSNSLRPIPSAPASTVTSADRQEVVSIHDVFSGPGAAIATRQYLDVMNSTPVHGNIPSTAFTPMSVSPMVRQQPQTPASVGSRTGMPSLDKQYPSSVTVFGFPPESSAAVLAHFRNFGNIKSYQFVGNTNWMNIEYENDVQAQMALSKNGTIIGDTMLGVVPMRKKHQLSGNAPESLNSIISPLKSPSQQAQIMANVSARKPLNQLSDTASDWSLDNRQTRPMLPSAYAKPLPSGSIENTATGQPSSIIGKVMENIFGW